MVKICLKCKIKFNPNSGSQKYCEGCVKQVRLEYARKYYRDIFYVKHSDRILAKQREHRAINHKPEYSLKLCRNCGNEYTGYYSGKFCEECKLKRKKGHIKVKCFNCGEACYKWKYQIQEKNFCSSSCANSYNSKGEKSNFWRGGRTINCNGYVMIHSPNHPFKNARNYVFEHRSVMEKHIGRYLKPEERIHHINSNKQDNRIENLKLFKNESEHQKYHHKMKHDKILLSLQELSLYT